MRCLRYAGGAVNQELPYDLTIVTVCRNALHVLPRCIASIQPVYRTPLRVEHLVVDGASTDGSVPFLWCQCHAGRITRFISEPDAGIYHAMNKAIWLARGKVLVFINADDELCPEAVVSCCAPVLNGKAQYAVASALYVDGKRERELRPRCERSLWRQPYCHQAMYCRRDLLVRMGGFDADAFPIGADTDLMRRLYVARISCEVVPEVAARFHVGGASSAPATCRDVFELLLKFAADCRLEVSRKPLLIHTIIKHLRRYANKKMMLNPLEGVPQADAVRMADFVRTVIEPLSVTRRLMLHTQLRFQRWWYAGLAHYSKGRKQQAARLNREISTLFTNCIY